jgi:RNA polymerase sigma factor (sigma-70 family)
VRGARAYRGLQDTQLLALVAERDGGALDGLYDRYGKLAYSLAHRILGDQRLAEDVTQSVFLTLWREAGRFGAGATTVGAHLLTQVHHRALDVIRGNETLRRQQAARGNLAFHLGGSTTRRDRGPDPAGGPFAATAGSHAAGRRGEGRTEGRPADPGQVQRALAALHHTEREALALAYFGGYTQREIAALVGVPLATVKTRMAAGLRHLRDALVTGGQEEPSPWTPR